jgi:hypothetical protein
MIEYYAPKARAEAEAVEATIWPLVKDRYADNTERWADILEHPTTGKFGVILPEDWRELSVSIAEVDIQTQEEMEQAGWFPTDEE